MELDEAQALAETLIQIHLGASSGWHFNFDRAKNRIGMCNYTFKRISLSIPLTLVNDEERIHRTILHEIGHALAGNDAGHGPKWKAACRSIGLTNPTRTSATVAAEHRYYALHVGCNRQFHRDRLTKNAHNEMCSVCWQTTRNQSTALLVWHDRRVLLK